MRQELAKLFPELDLIKDPQLREKVLDVWEEAMQRAGWTVQDLDEIPFTLLIPDTKVNLVQHTRAVTRVALESARVLQEQYGDVYEIDFDALVAGGLLHDVGKLLEYRREGGSFVKSDTGRLLRHPFSGAGLATKHGLSDKIVHIIATHAKEGDGGYRCPESVIVHHADFMNFEPLKML